MSIHIKNNFILKGTEDTNNINKDHYTYYLEVLKLYYDSITNFLYSI
jgi:hypothetical protein